MKTYIWGIVALMVVAAALAVAAYIYFFGISMTISDPVVKPVSEVGVVDEINEDWFQTTSEASLDAFDVSGGIVYADDESVTRRGQIKIYDIATKESTTLIDDVDLYFRSPAAYTKDAVDTIAFLSSPYVADAPWTFPYNEYLQLHTHTEGGVVRQNLISDTKIGNQLGLTWSEAAGLFASYGLSQSATNNSSLSSGEELLVENWSVYLSSATDIAIEIKNAVSPTWSADGAYVYFLRNNGVYRYSVRSENIEVVNSPVGRILTPKDSLVLLQNDTQLVVSDIQQGGFHVLEHNPTENSIQYVQYIQHTDGTYPYHLSTVADRYVLYSTVDESTNTVKVRVVDPETSEMAEVFTTEVVLPYSLEPQWISEMVSFK